MLQRVFIVIMGIGLAACGSFGVPKPPSAPTIQEIGTNVQAAKKVAQGTTLPNSSTADPTTLVSATDAAIAGYMLVDLKCTDFFSAVQDWSNTSGFARKEVTLVGAAAAGILGAISATATSIALTAIGFGLAAESIDNFQNFALFTPKPTSVRKLVRQAMDAYKQAAPPSNAALFDGNILIAQDYVANYAALCTYAGIQQFVEEAVATATATATPQGMFTESDKIILPEVNAEVGLPRTPLA